MNTKSVNARNVSVCPIAELQKSSQLSENLESLSVQDRAASVYRGFKLMISIMIYNRDYSAEFQILQDRHCSFITVAKNW